MGCVLSLLYSDHTVFDYDIILILPSFVLIPLGLFKAPFSFLRLCHNSGM